MLNIISFLTRIPVREEVRIEEVATKSYLFPLVALFIGLFVAVAAFLSFGLLATTPEIAALLTLLTIYLVTGLIHLDGLADFFDGLMATGSRGEKVNAMKDAKIGISGLFAAMFVILTTLFAIEAVCTREVTFKFDLASFYKFAAVFITAELCLYVIRQRQNT